MPSRRTTLIGVGALVAGGTGAVATGAFTTATAERTVDVGFAEDDTQAILAFEDTSDYAEINDDGELAINFDDLNTSAQFTFNDTFIIANNTDQTDDADGTPITLTEISSDGDDDDPQWRNEASGESAGVLIAENTNEWQSTPTQGGSTLAPEDIVNVEEWDEEDDTDGDVYDAETNDFNVTLEPGDWVSVGFEIGFLDESDPNDVPETLQFNFESNVENGD